MADIRMEVNFLTPQNEIYAFCSQMQEKVLFEWIARERKWHNIACMFVLIKSNYYAI